MPSGPTVIFQHATLSTVNMVLITFRTTFYVFVYVYVRVCVHVCRYTRLKVQVQLWACMLKLEFDDGSHLPAHFQGLSIKPRACGDGQAC